MRKRGVVILMAAALTASVPATALADQFAGQIAFEWGGCFGRCC